MLILNGVQFPVCTDESWPMKTMFSIYESDNDTIRIYFEGGFAKNSLDGEDIRPSFIINPFETNKTKISELIGMTFEVNTVEESYEREDSFYVWEHEPFIKIKLKIADIDTDNGKVHIECEGIAIIDAYTIPYITAPFSFEGWVPVSRWEEAVKQFGI